MKKIIVLLIIACGVNIFGINLVMARPQYLSAFENTYPEIIGKNLDKCIMCHIENPETGNEARNPYGIDYGRKKNFISIESLDSDRDGRSNIVEIKNFKFPGNDKDFPEMTIADQQSITTATEKTQGFGILASISIIIALYLKKKKE